jgi:hypothetical protein
MKGAFVELKDGGIVGVSPNVILFQYNPETLSRTITPHRPHLGELTGEPREGAEEAEGGGEEATEETAACAQPEDPRETFNLSLLLDATEDLNEGSKLAIATGVADRIAAIKLLTYGSTLMDRALDAIGDAIGGALGVRQPEERPAVSVVLFWFGFGRLVPVRITSLSIEEQAFHSVSLYPVRARISVGLKVLRPHELECHEDSLSATIARGCYRFTYEQEGILAAAGKSYRALDTIFEALDSDLGDML